MGKKENVLVDIFGHCKKKEDFVFHNDLVKNVCKKYNFGNPFDVTKLDNTGKIPKEILHDDYFIVHLGNGNHQFVKGISKGYHQFEKIENIIKWQYKKSLLNEFDTSESNILSLGFNQRIIHDFVYEDIAANPKVYGAKRTKGNFSYKIDNIGVETKNVQIEIDLTTELDRIITVFEGKNGFPKDFSIYQIYLPFLYYSKLKEEHSINIKKVNCCYLLREKHSDGSIVRMYKYSFDDIYDMTSIKLLLSKQYNLTFR